jgi:hypothetical protein
MSLPAGEPPSPTASANEQVPEALRAVIDLRVTQLDGLTLAFVFMRPGPAFNAPDHAESIAEILGSVCVSNLETEACCE